MTGNFRTLMKRLVNGHKNIYISGDIKVEKYNENCQWFEVFLRVLEKDGTSRYVRVISCLNGDLYVYYPYNKFQKWCMAITEIVPGTKITDTTFERFYND